MSQGFVGLCVQGGDKGGLGGFHFRFKARQGLIKVRIQANDGGLSSNVCGSRGVGGNGEAGGFGRFIEVLNGLGIGTADSLCVLVFNSLELGSDGVHVAIHHDAPHAVNIKLFQSGLDQCFELRTWPQVWQLVTEDITEELTKRAIWG